MKFNLFKLIINLFLIFKSYSLAPYRLPNGKVVKFNINKIEPKNDLYIITESHAKLISKNWIENIVLDVYQKQISNKLKNSNLFEYNQQHIVNDINFLFKNTSNNNLFLTWKPLGMHGRKLELFLILIKYQNKKKIQIIQIIQSPFWDPINIPSIHLKNSLENLFENKNIEIDYNELYKNNYRLYFSWKYNLNE